jgi:hypothetical protein
MRGAASIPISVLFAVAVGCAADDDTADTGETAEPATPLTATLQRSTLFETRRSLRLTVTNGGNQELEFGAVQLSSPLFEPVPPQTRDVRCRPVIAWPSRCLRHRAVRRRCR